MTMLKRLVVIGLAVLALNPVLVLAQDNNGQQSKAEKEKPEFKPIADVVKDAEKREGFLTLYRSKDKLWLEIPETTFDKPFMMSVSIAKGIAQGDLVAGMTWTESIFYWKKADNRIFLVDKNVRHTAPKSNPIRSAVDRGFGDSVIAAFGIQGKSGNKYLVDLSEFLFTDYSMVGQSLSGVVGKGYALDRKRTTWGTYKVFPQNVEIEVDATYAGSSSRDIRTVSDSRAISITHHYSFSEIPKSDYKPRNADDRIGYFLTAVKDYSKHGTEEPFIRYINRWKLEKADPKASLSPPKKPIVFYIEKSVPYEYRPIVRSGLEEWNKAYEKAGFVNAIEVRYQEDGAEWDAEDVRYNTIRWMTGEAGYAIGPSRVNPETGEIYDADILVDSGWLQYFEWQYETFTDALADRSGTNNEDDTPISLEAFAQHLHDKNNLGGSEDELNTLRRCEYADGLREQMAIAALSNLVRDGDGDSGDGLEEFIRQGLKELIMHEVGHTLGLRHNFKSSSVVALDDLHNKELTAKTGLVGSVMDYSVVNIAPKGVDQGFYFTPTLGPWDYLAIEYGYSELSKGKNGDGVDPLDAIAARAAEPQHAYATDGDVGRDIDPLANLRDMSDDPLAFAQQRADIVEELWDGLLDNAVEAGEGYQKVRNAFLFTLSHKQTNIYHASRYVGGFYFNRNHKGDPGEKPVFEVVPAKRQREALRFVCDDALSDAAYDFDPDLLARLAPNRWDHWGSVAPFRMDTPVHDMVLSGQLRVLSRLFSSSVLNRVHDGMLYVGDGGDVFTLDEIYREVTESVFAELDQDVTSEKWGGGNPYVSSYRRNLQRAYLKYVLLDHVLDPSVNLPQDARSIAWATLRDLRNRMTPMVRDSKSDAPLDAMSAAHLEESLERVNKALDAAFSVTNF
jgi:hypothetical protein